MEVEEVIWLLKDEVPEELELDFVVGAVLWLLLVGADEETEGEQAEGLHEQTVTVTVTGQSPAVEALIAALLVITGTGGTLPLPCAPCPRGSMSCWAARGVAATSPRREGRMMEERMAMRTCENSSGGKRLLENVFVLTVLSLWYRRSKTLD